MLRILVIVNLLIRLHDCKDYCHNEEFVADCRASSSPTAPTSQVVLIENALYGRMNKGPCVKTDFGYIGCSKEVTKYVHRRCSGRPSCSIRVPDPILDKTKPCNEDLKSYLEANFSCVSISQPKEDGDCHSTIPLTNFPLFISRAHTQFRGTAQCGEPQKPWLVTAQVGQKINITLMDFSTASTLLSFLPSPSSSSSSSSSSSNHAYHQPYRNDFLSYRFVSPPTSSALQHPPLPLAKTGSQVAAATATDNINLPSDIRSLTCDQYALIEETLSPILHVRSHHPKPSPPSSASSSSLLSSSSSLTQDPSVKHFMCGNGTQPHTRNYISQTHEIRLSLLLPPFEDHYYLIKIQAIGCPDSLPTTSNSWVRRESADEMTLGCLNGEQTWRLSCVGHRWEGDPANCSAVGANDARRDDLSTFSIGAAVFVVIGVSLFIGLLVLFIGLYYIRKRRTLLTNGLQMRDMRPLNSDLTYSQNSTILMDHRSLTNNALKQHSSSTSGKHGKTGFGSAKSNKEYECVWEIPSGKSLTLSSRDESPNKKTNQFLNENRSSTTSKLESFKSKNLIVKAPLNGDFKQRMTFSTTGGQTKNMGDRRCSCCCSHPDCMPTSQPPHYSFRTTSGGNENFSNFERAKFNSSFTGASAPRSHMTIGHSIASKCDSSAAKPVCMTFPKQSSLPTTTIATHQNILNNTIAMSLQSGSVPLDSDSPCKKCRHCGHTVDDTSDQTASDAPLISESTPSIFCDSTAPGPVLPRRVVPPQSETLSRRLIGQAPLNAAEVFKRSSRDTGMPGSVGQIRRNQQAVPNFRPLQQQQQQQRQHQHEFLSQRHSSEPPSDNNQQPSSSTESAETPPILHPRKHRT